MDRDIADVVLLNGRVTTMSPPGLGPAEAEAVAIRDGRILAVGATREIEVYIGERTEVLDMAGRRVIPGLIDSHVHFARAGLTWNDETHWEGVRDLATALSLIERDTHRRPPGSWIRVHGGWHHEQFAEHRPPTRAELDAVTPDHPTVVQLMYEWGMLNTSGIRTIGLTAEVADAVDPAAFDRDADGTPNGVVRGMAALRWLYSQLPKPTFEEQVASTAAASREFSRMGITGLIDGGGTNSGPDIYRAVYEVWRRHQLTTRVRLTVHSSGPNAEPEELPGYLRFTHHRFGDDLLRVLGVGEIILYAVHDSETRRPDLSTPVVNQLLEVFESFAAARWPLQIHAQRAETVESVLDLWERVIEKYPIDELRWSLVHAECLTPPMIARVKRLGVGVLTPTLFRFEGDIMLDLWGEELMKTSPPLRAVLDAGIPLGGGTDAMRVASYNPYEALHWYLTGYTMSGRPTRNAENLLSREEALRIYTIGAAWFSFEENLRGSLDPGKLADVVVLDKDYFHIPEDEIPSIQPDLTVVGGKIVWRSPALDTAAIPLQPA